MLVGAGPCDGACGSGAGLLPKMFNITTEVGSRVLTTGSSQPLIAMPVGS
jgi:hypothetical protein